MYKEDTIVTLIKKLFPNQSFIPLHEPQFIGNEKKYLTECINSTFVSSSGEYVEKFEKMICEYTHSNYAVATTNGTSALHIALLLSDIKHGDEILTQALTFIATANAISYCGAEPLFIDSAIDNMGICPQSLTKFLEENCIKKDDGFTYNKITRKRVKACVPMHVFGHPVKLDEIISICKQYNISVIEDAAESIGSYYKGQHTGTIAPIGILSFNGNKTITCGGGGMILLQDKVLAQKAKHLTTTAKLPHKWEFIHDMIGYNYRLPNLNAALACAQMEMLPSFLASKRELASIYKNEFNKIDITFVNEPFGCISNFWLNAIQVESLEARNAILEYTNANSVMTRPIWKLLCSLPPFKNCYHVSLQNAENYEKTIINIPSSARIK